jgi:hypothetical protein
MRLIDPVSSNGQEPPSGVGLLESDIPDRFDIVDIVDNDRYGEVYIVTEKGGAKEYAATAEARKQVRIGELGASGTRWRRILGGEEYNDTLAGLNGLDVYEKMRRSDASVRSSLRLAKTPILGARWYVEAPDPDNETQVTQARFVEEALFRRMTIDWSQIIQEALLMLDFGYYMFEPVFNIQKFEGKDRVFWQKWAPRSPKDTRSDGWEYDSHGGPNGVWLSGFDGEEYIWHPIDRLLVFTYDRETNNVEGIPLLRSVYQHWYMKSQLYKIDAIQKERHGIGVPVIHLPVNFSAKDKAMADELGRNLRTNEKAHIVLPPNWTIEFAKLEGHPVNAMTSIEHHDLEIYKNVLGQFVNTGASASKAQDIDLYIKATRFVADIFANVIQKHAIPKLIDFNWRNTKEYPRLRYRKLGETTDWRMLSFAIRNFIGADVIRSDETLEKWVRDEMDLPPIDLETVRLPEENAPATGGTPRPPKVGLPRQGKPSAGQGDAGSGGKDVGGGGMTGRAGTGGRVSQ